MLKCDTLLLPAESPDFMNPRGMTATQVNDQRSPQNVSSRMSWAVWPRSKEGGSPPSRRSLRIGLRWCSVGMLTLWACSMSVASALPPEVHPLKPRVPTELRAHYRNLPSPLYQRASDASEEVVEQGRAVYERICQNCHGATGEGNGLSAEFLSVLPRNFTSCLFQRKRTDGELYYVIQHGSWPMPPMMPSITEEEAWAVIAFTRTFCAK